MINVYQQIARNKQRSLMIISIFILFIITAAYIISNTFGIKSLIPVALIFSLFSALSSYFWGEQIILGLNQARPATRREFFDFYTVVENLSLVAKIPVPKIYTIDSPALNAFATGRDPKHAIVCATTGLLQKLNRTELEGVIGHELSHIKNYDTLLMTIVSILIGTLSIIINTSTHSMIYHNDDDKEKNTSGIMAILGIILIIFAPIIAQLIQLAISRRREFFADSASVMLTRQPSGLISALTKISQDKNILKTASTATSSLYISNPFKHNKIASLFSTHPPIEDRIKALKGLPSDF